MLQFLGFLRGFLTVVIGISLTGCSSPMHEAAYQGDLQAVERTLEQGARVNAPDVHGDQLLHIAARTGNLELAQLALRRGAVPDQPNAFRQSPLAVAAEAGQLPLVRFFFDQGAQLESADHQGDTPLHLAAKSGHQDVVRFLIEQGVNPHKPNKFQETPQQLAKEAGFGELAAYLGTLPYRRAAQPTPMLASRADRTPPRLEAETPGQRGIELEEVTATTRIFGTATDDSGFVQVSVLGRRVTLDQSGRFEARLALSSGTNRIEVVARDQAGNETRKQLELQGAEGVSAPQPAPLSGGKYYALIIGNAAYQKLPPLKTPAKDAQAVEKLLRERYGFNTKLMLEADKESISRALNGYRQTLGAEDSFLLYYAGHGIFDPTVNKAYWLPIDAEKTDDTHWLITDSITANLQRLPARHVLVIADSCYSGTLTRAVSVDMETPSRRDEYLGKLAGRTSRTLMASGGNEPVTDGSREGHHSVFAQALLEALQSNPGGPVTAEEMFLRQIKEKVAGNSEQIPEYSVIRNSGHQGGDFVFPNPIR